MAHDPNDPAAGPGAGGDPHPGGPAGGAGAARGQTGDFGAGGGYGYDARGYDGRGYGGGDRSGFGGYGAGGAYGGGAGSRLFDDLARLVTDAAGATQGVRREVETAMRAQMEAVLGRLDVVRRDEFEAMSEVARRARAEAEALHARVEALEAKLGAGNDGDPEKN